MIVDVDEAPIREAADADSHRHRADGARQFLLVGRKRQAWDGRFGQRRSNIGLPPTRSKNDLHDGSYHHADEDADEHPRRPQALRPSEKVVEDGRKTAYREGDYCDAR